MHIYIHVYTCICVFFRKKWRSWVLYALCVCDALPQALFFRKKWRSWIVYALCVCDALPQVLFFPKKWRSCVEITLQQRPSRRINYRIVWITLQNGPFHRINYVKHRADPVDVTPTCVYQTCLLHLPSTCAHTCDYHVDAFHYKQDRFSSGIN